MRKIFLLIFTFVFFVQLAFAAEFSTEAMLQYNQGIDYYKLGQYDQAIASFRSAIKLEPNYIDAYYNLGSVLEYLKQYDAALPIFKQIIVRKPDDYDSVYKAAWLSYKLGEYQKAKTYLGIIPSSCSRAKEASVLALEINSLIGSETISSEPKPQAKPPVNQVSGIYQEIPAPTGISSDGEGNIYVAEFNTNVILKITPDGKKVVYINDAKISGPIGLAFDKSKNLYIANYNKDNVLKVSPYGEVSVLISNLKKPYYLYIDGKILFVSCQGSNSVLRYKLP